MKIQQILWCVAVAALLSACHRDIHRSAGGVPPCAVSPPLSSKAENSVKTQLAVDLTNFSRMPGSATFSAEAAKKIEATFNAIPEKQLACGMLLQTYTCITEKTRASEFLQYVRSTGQCRT
ncbi:hypothetical protein [Vagococcus sp. WN89Y]|uniref:hypothetical protein n=1 Tax=Vagococcus sp. WN89Y TaxID=3457258 RepID=UPI003FCD7D94